MIRRLLDAYAEHHLRSGARRSARVPTKVGRRGYTGPARRPIAGMTPRRAVYSSGPTAASTAARTVPSSTSARAASRSAFR